MARRPEEFPEHTPGMDHAVYRFTEAEIETNAEQSAARAEKRYTALLVVSDPGGRDPARHRYVPCRSSLALAFGANNGRGLRPCGGKYRSVRDHHSLVELYQGVQPHRSPLDSGGDRDVQVSVTTETQSSLCLRGDMTRGTRMCRDRRFKVPA